MALHIQLGQYYASDSPVHKLDARVKLICMLAVMLVLFFIRTPLQLLVGLVGAMTALALAHIPLAKTLEALRPLLVVLLILASFNLFFTRDGLILFEWGLLRITDAGIQAAFIFSFRLIIGVIAALLVLFTTTPTQLTDACEVLLSPLAHIGLPAHELAMVFALMLRFIPTLIDEASAIIDAQTARGGAIQEGGPLRRIRALIPILVALLASSIHHANNLSRALDARSYSGSNARSMWHPFRLSVQDMCCAVCVCLYIALIVVLR